MQRTAADENQCTAYVPVYQGCAGRISLDILIVAYVIYRIALLIRGTRTMQMVVGLGDCGGRLHRFAGARPVHPQLAAE